MSSNHVLLETIELNQQSVSVTFDNIPQTGYTDLKIVFSGLGNTTEGTYIAFNGSTANFSGIYAIGDGGSQASGSLPRYLGSIQAQTVIPNAGEIYIFNYTSNSSKTFSVLEVQENNGATGYQNQITGLWSQSAAITSITLDAPAGYKANSTFSLYGIAAVGTTPTVAPKATGGNVVANDGTYWYHAFLSSGYFVPQTPLTCDVLTIAGGGAGASGGGGGGAGGLVYAASNSLVTTGYSVTVGAGGTGTYENKGTNGSNSQFGSLTAAVGGGAGGTDYVAGLAVESGNTGGSGGGAGQNPTAGGTFGTGTSGQGNNGGTGSTSGAAYGGGGGGGATAAGGNGTGSAGGNGGAGSSAYSSWGLATLTGQNVSGTYWFAGGGGAGSNAGSLPTGGNGGGGTGALGTAQPGSPGIKATGGGGGASSGGAGGGRGASGGSGVVIIRYPMA